MSHPERESDQMTLPLPASSTVAWGTCNALPPSSRRLELPSDEEEEEEDYHFLGAMYDWTRESRVWPNVSWSGNGHLSSRPHRLVGLVVRRPPPERKIPGSNPAFTRNFSGSGHTSDSKIGITVTTLPSAWRYRVSAGTGRPCISILWLGEVESWSATSISVWQHVKLSEQIGPWDTIACCWDIKQPTNKQTSRPQTWFISQTVSDCAASETDYTEPKQSNHFKSLAQASIQPCHLTDLTKTSSGSFMHAHISEVENNTDICNRNASLIMIKKRGRGVGWGGGGGRIRFKG